MIIYGSNFIFYGEIPEGYILYITSNRKSYINIQSIYNRYKKKFLESSRGFSLFIFLQQDFDQIIESEVIFTGPVSVNQDIKTYGQINGKDLNRLVTLYSNQNLSATYRFDGKSTIDSNLDVNGLVNGIDVLYWYENSVSSNSESTQYITNPVVVHGNVTFDDGFYNDGFIGGWNLSYVSNIVRNKLNMKHDMEYKSKVL